MACIGTLCLMVSIIFFLGMERWWSLLGSIIKGDPNYLKQDILESGICEKKREGWIPPQKSWWDMTKEERAQDKMVRQEQWQRQRHNHVITPAHIHVKPKLPQWSELDDLEAELFAELDE